MIASADSLSSYCTDKAVEPRPLNHLSIQDHDLRPEYQATDELLIIWVCLIEFFEEFAEYQQQFPHPGPV